MIRTLAVRGAPAIGIAALRPMEWSSPPRHGIPHWEISENLWRKAESDCRNAAYGSQPFLGFGANEKCLAGKRRNL